MNPHKEINSKRMVEIPYFDPDTRVNISIGEQVSVSGEIQNGWITIKTIHNKICWFPANHLSPIKDTVPDSSNKSGITACLHCKMTNHHTDSCFHRYRSAVLIKPGDGTFCSICKKNNHTEDMCYFRPQKEETILCESCPPTDRGIIFPVRQTQVNNALIISGSFLSSAIELIGQILHPGIDPSQLIFNQELFFRSLKRLLGPEFEFSTRIIIQGTPDGRPTDFLNSMHCFEKKIGGLKTQFGTDPDTGLKTSIVSERGLDISIGTMIFNAAMGLKNHSKNQNIVVISDDCNLLPALESWSSLTNIKIISMSDQDPSLEKFNFVGEKTLYLEDVLMSCVKRIGYVNTKYNCS